MGFRAGAHARVWEVEHVSDRNTKVRLSINAYNKLTDSWEQDFGDYCNFYGSAVAPRAAKLKRGDFITLDSVDVSNRYDKENKRVFYTFKVFDFTVKSTSAPDDDPEEGATVVAEAEVDDSNLPF